jgi:hypothetical protein
MTIDAYLEAMKERFVTAPLVTHFQVIRERSTLMDGYLRARLTLAGKPLPPKGGSLRQQVLLPH